MTTPTPISSKPGTNPDALQRLFAAPLRRYFLRRGCKTQDVDDLVQEVFFRVVRLGKIETIENPNGYVFKIAANILRDKARKRRTRYEDMHQSFDDLLHGQEEISPERQLSGKQDLVQLRARIMAMPKKTQTVFLLHRFEDLKYREIADVLGISVSSVEKHMMKALQKIAALLRQS